MKPSDIVARLKERFPKIQGPAAQDICYATENRQLAVKAVVPLCQMLLVVGSQNSSNSRRLVEVCQKIGVPAYLIDDLSEVRPEWLEGVETVAVTAGASAPENLVEELIAVAAAAAGYTELEEMEIKEEDVRFNLPTELARTRAVANCRAGMTSQPASRATRCSTACARDHAPRGRLSARPPDRARLLVGRPDRRHHARIRLHPAGAVAASAAKTGCGIRRRAR